MTITPSFALFLLAVPELRRVEYGQHAPKQLFSLYFRSIPRDYTVFLTRGFPFDVLCMSVLLIKLTLIEEPGTRT